MVDSPYRCCGQECRHKSVISPTGFTLIELLAVISIIALMATMGAPLIELVNDNQRRSRAKSDLDTLALALESFKLSNESYPVFNPANKNLSTFADDQKGAADEKKSSEALFLALTGWIDENGESLMVKSATNMGGRPIGYLNLGDFSIGGEMKKSKLREQLENLADKFPEKPSGLYFIDPWRQPYLYKFPVLSTEKSSGASFPIVTRRQDYLLISKGPDKEINSSSSPQYGPKTWLSSEDAGVDLSDYRDAANYDNLYQGMDSPG